MKPYEEQYYIVRNVYNEDTVYLKPTKQTGKRKYKNSQLVFGEEPLIFEESFDKAFHQKGKQPVFGDAHMDGIYPIVSQKVYDLLKHLNVNNFQLYPAIIMDPNGNYIENYYFFNIYDRLNCVDFDKSELINYKKEALRHTVRKFIIKSEVLDPIEEENRFILHPHKVFTAPMIVHKDIVNIFNKLKIKTIRFLPLSDYALGSEFNNQ